MTPDEKAVVYCRYGLKLLSVLGLIPEQGETLEEFGIRAKKQLFDADDEEDDGVEHNAGEKCDGTGDCLDFIGQYEFILYSNKKTDDEDLKGILKNIDELFLLIRWYRGYVRTMFIKLKYVM